MTPASAGAPTLGRLLRLPDDPHAWIFGLARHGGQWVIGVGYTDVRNIVELRPITASGIADPSHTLRLHDFPLALVPSSKSAPWAIVEDGSLANGSSGSYVAHGFAGGHDVALSLPKRDPGMRESTVRHAWRGGDSPRGAAVYTTSIVRQRTQAELDASRKARSPGAPSSSESAFVTLAQTARHYGGGPKSFEAARFKETGRVEIGWREVAVGDDRWVGAHWLSEETRNDADPPKWSVALHWFDMGGTRKRASRTIAAPAGSSGILTIAADGTTYLVSDGTDPFGKSSRIVVSAFDTGGNHRGDRDLAVSGWVADTMTTITCEGHTWLALDAYVGGTESLDVVELVPEGPLAPRRLWSGVDPLPSPHEGSRPGRVLFAACGEQSVGLATQLLIANVPKPDPARQEETTDPGVLLVEWPNR